MQTRAVLIGICSLLLVSMACSLSSVTATSSGTSTNSNTGTSTSPAGFSATAASPVSVQLKWGAVSGATSYLLEVSFNAGDFFTRAQIPADQTSYEDILPPGSADVNYRLTAFTSSGNKDIGTVALTMPALVPNPLTVQPNDYKPIAWIPGTPDPQDPSKVYPPGFDPAHPENFDPSKLIQMVEASADIGPQGGKVTITTPDKITFTLTIPPNALDDLLTITLTPEQSLDGLPLSGGLLGAVRITPELHYNFPAALTIQRDTGAPATAPLTVGFTVSDSSHEFSLVPLASPAGQSNNLPGAVQLIGFTDGGTSTTITVNKGNTYGIGAATPADVQAQAVRIPTDAGAQIQQHIAQEQASGGYDPAASFRQTGEGILQRGTAGNDWQSLMSMADALDNYWYDGGYKYNNTLNAKLVDKLLDKIKTLLDKNKGDCLTQNDAVAGQLGGKISKPQSDFWKFVQGAYKTRFGQAGQQLLDDLAVGNKGCKFELEIDSTILLKLPDGTVNTHVKKVQPIPLHTVYEDNHMYLQGQGQVSYDKYTADGASCPKREILPYPIVNIVINTLAPMYDTDNSLADLWLMDIEASAVPASLSGFAKYVNTQGCPVSNVKLLGGDDFWSGGFTTMRNYMRRQTANSELTGWTSPSGTFKFSGKAPLVLTKVVANQTITIATTQITETTTFKLTITPGKTK